MMKLCIAGLPVCIDSADKAFFSRRYADYVRTDDRPPVMTMRCRRVPELPHPEGETMQQVGRAAVVRTADGRFCRFACSQTGQVLFTITYTPDYAEVNIALLETRRHPVFSLTDWEYMYTGAMFHNRLMQLGGGVLHSSSLAWRGQGVAFSANSGTGKSTHTGLWKQVFGDEVEIINDDKPAIWFDEGQPMLCGTPWSGKTALNLNRQVPLRAIVFIERGEKNAIRRLDDFDAFCRLVEQIARPYYDAALGEGAVDFARRLLSSLPVYCLTCNISTEAVHTAFQAIFAQEEEA